MSLIIKSTKDKSNLTLNVLVYGHDDVDLTQLITQLEEPLVLNANDAMIALAHANIDYVDCKTIADASTIARDLRTDDCKKYKSIVLNTVTEFGQHILPPIREKYEERAKAKDKGVDGRQYWGEFGQTIGRIIKSLRACEKDLYVFADAIEKENEEGRRIINPDIYGKSSQRIAAWLGEVFYMHHKDGKDFFLTEASDRIIAKDASGKLERVEPADLKLIKKKILG